jgi:voltage-gated potassium channel
MWVARRLLRLREVPSTHTDLGVLTMDDKKHSREQYRALRQLEDWLEMPMFFLSIIWAVLLVVELASGLGPVLQTAVTVIWVIFIIEFAIKLVIAPRKLAFLRKSWLTIFSLALPALRVFRVARVVNVLRAGRAVRGLTLARVLTAFSRGLRSLRTSLGRFGFGYVVALTLLVTGLGAAGMFAFESRRAGGGLATFGDALWFTAMLMTTSGSDYWPKTPEGRALCFLLALYAFAIFVYVTATVATLLIGQDTRSSDGAKRQEVLLKDLQRQLTLMNRRLETLNGQGCDR